MPCGATHGGWRGVRSAARYGLRRGIGGDRTAPGQCSLALLFFNIGIEIGQIAFILVLLAAWFVIKKPLAPWQGRLLPIPVYILGALSAMWCIERGLEALLA